jgi:hypothetical protein
MQGKSLMCKYGAEKTYGMYSIYRFQRHKLCAMNAIKTNVACKALYERLRANGKTGKQALIAVCNKLLKQVFAVVKNNTLYQPNYCSAKP